VVVNDAFAANVDLERTQLRDMQKLAESAGELVITHLLHPSGQNRQKRQSGVRFY